MSVRSELTPFPFPWGSFGPSQKLTKSKTIPGEQLWSLQEPEDIPNSPQTAAPLILEAKKI